MDRKYILWIKVNKLFIAIIILLLASLLAIAIVVPIVLSGNNDNNNHSKKPYDPSKLSEDEKSRVNCFLEEESRFEHLSQYKCESRGCIYRPSDYERVPTCFFNSSAGYLLDEQTADGFVLIRDANVQAPFLRAIEKLNLTVEYLGNQIIHVKVIKYYLWRVFKAEHFFYYCQI